MTSKMKDKKHSRRARNTDKGSSWISYSDMMAALILMFILVLSYTIYQYFIMLQVKTEELDSQGEQLKIQQSKLDEQEEILLGNEQILILREKELEETQLTLSQREDVLKELQAKLVTKEEELDEAQDLLSSQQQRIDDLIGVRTNIIQNLSTTLLQSDISATVDLQTGDIILDSAVFFDTGSATIKKSGKDFLDMFIPLYFEVLFSKEYENYLAEIIIEGHTDSQGTYSTNLRLSQQRARSVVEYCLQIPNLTKVQKDYFRQIQTATGKSYANRIFNEDGTENMEASRRVEFKFRLKDAEMVEEMRKILTGEN